MISHITLRAIAGAGITSLLLPKTARAHVKWFSDYQSEPTPVDWTQLFHLQLWAIVAGFMVLMLAASLIRHTWPKLESLGFEFNLGRNGIRNRHLFVVALILAAIALGLKRNLILTPELQSQWQIASMVQLMILSLSVIPKLRFILPLGLVALFVISCAQHGAIHMVDYAFFLGIAWFLWCTRPGHELSGYRRGMTGLYRLTGFALCWVATEKLIHPNWAAQVIAQQPILSLGFPVDFFIRGAALVEFTIGYLFILQHWSRVSAMVLTGVMIMTAMLFGMTEIVGHLPLHAILILFFMDGRVRFAQCHAESVESDRNKRYLQAGSDLVRFAATAVALTSVYYAIAIWKAQMSLA